MAYGAIRHRKALRMTHAALRRSGGWGAGIHRTKKMNVGVKLVAYNVGGRGVRYRASACFFPGWKAGEDHRRAGPGGTVVPLYKNRRRLSERCGESGWETGPTKAVQRALKSLAGKKL
jgi:hypothetical protein